VSHQARTALSPLPCAHEVELALPAGVSRVAVEPLLSGVAACATKVL